MVQRNLPPAILSVELERAALRAVRRAFEDLNGSLFGWRLRIPHFELTDNTSVLGRWLGGARIIELSRTLLIERGWAVLVEVLKHEMAHQYVDEILGHPDESVHGPEFRRVCEERGSGIDKVVSEVELFQLPAPLFENPPGFTKATLFAHKPLSQMDRAERIRACYLHACRRYVMRQPMTNASLRLRFGRDALLPGLEHDRRAVRVVGPHEQHVVTAQSLEAHPDVGLDVFDDVA